MALTLAEQIEMEKNNVRQVRNRKLKDRKNKHGRDDLAQTDGLKPVRVHGRRNGTIQIDDCDLDPRRIRNLNDIDSLLGDD